MPKGPNGEKRPADAVGLHGPQSIRHFRPRVDEYQTAAEISN